VVGEKPALFFFFPLPKDRCRGRISCFFGITFLMRELVVYTIRVGKGRFRLGLDWEFRLSLIGKRGPFTR